MSTKTKFITLYYRDPKSRSFVAIPSERKGGEVKLMIQNGIPIRLVSMDDGTLTELKR